MFSELLLVFCKEVHTKNKELVETLKNNAKFELQSIILDDFGRRQANLVMTQIGENFMNFQ